MHLIGWIKVLVLILNYYHAHVFSSARLYKEVFPSLETWWKIHFSHLFVFLCCRCLYISIPVTCGHRLRESRPPEPRQLECLHGQAGDKVFGECTSARLLASTTTFRCHWTTTSITSKRRFVGLHCINYTTASPSIDYIEQCLVLGTAPPALAPPLGTP